MQKKKDLLFSVSFFYHFKGILKLFLFILMFLILLYNYFSIIVFFSS